MSRTLSERMSSDLSKNFALRVEGLRTAIRALEDAGVDAAELKTLMNQVGMVVVNEAKVTAPVESGTLRNDIRAAAQKTKAVVRVGRAKIPYAPVQEYGWPAHNIEGKHYMQEALERTDDKIFGMLEKGIDDILRRNNLK